MSRPLYIPPGRRTNVSPSGLRVSKRNWEKDRERKEQDIEDLSLVSRSYDGNNKHSLKYTHYQHSLWQHIKSKVEKVKDENNIKEWDPIVDQLRKLREGVYASDWSEGDYSFSIEVFELSVNCCIKAERYEELTKSLIGLLDELYKIQKKSTKPYYIVLGILFQACYMRNTQKAKDYSLHLNDRTNESIFGKQFIEAMLTGNPILYFKLYHHNPYLTFKILMKNYNETMQRKAIETLRKAYISTSINWVGRWIGVYNNDSVIEEVERLVKPTCIKSVDTEQQIVYFIKRPQPGCNLSPNNKINKKQG